MSRRFSPEEPIDHAIGRSRGGLTKIYMNADASGVPLAFMLSVGQGSDIANTQDLLN